MTESDKAQISRAVDAAVEQYGPVLEALGNEDDLTDHDIRMRGAKECEVHSGMFPVITPDKYDNGYNQALGDVLVVLNEDMQECLGDGYKLLYYELVRTKIEALRDK